MRQGIHAYLGSMQSDEAPTPSMGIVIRSRSKVITDLCPKSQSGSLGQRCLSEWPMLVYQESGHTSSILW